MRLNKWISLKTKTKRKKKWGSLCEKGSKLEIQTRREGGREGGAIMWEVRETESIQCRHVYIDTGSK